jgi:uncharacterized protein (DUF1015 family)
MLTRYQHQQAVNSLILQGFLRSISTRQVGRVLEPALGITPQAVTAEANLTYEREASAALDAVDCGRAQISFLLNPCDMEQVMKIATAGEVMPQKSTDCYSKLLSGITMYRVDG